MIQIIWTPHSLTRRAKSVQTLLALLAVVTLLPACASLVSDFTGVTDEPTEDDPIVARIDGVPIAQSELDQWLMDDWIRGLEQDPDDLYKLRRAGVEGVIDDTLIDRAAARSGLTSDDFLDREVAKLGPVTDREIDDFYARNKDRIQPAEPLEQLRPKIRTFLDEDRPIRIMNRLQGAANIEILMTPPTAPPVPRVELPRGDASRGPDDAPVTIVEFSDYQCPFCQRVEVTLGQLDALYPGKLRFEYRHFPLDFHPNALPAAVAATCAGQQERFWDYHNLLFENQKALSGPDLIDYAAQLELDSESFKSCINDEATVALVATDAEVGKAAGATATPTFYINGIVLRGAQGLDAFRTVIDQELAQADGAP